MGLVLALLLGSVAMMVVQDALDDLSALEDEVSAQADAEASARAVQAGGDDMILPTEEDTPEQEPAVADTPPEGVLDDPTVSPVPDDIEIAEGPDQSAPDMDALVVQAEMAGAEVVTGGPGDTLEGGEGIDFFSVQVPAEDDEEDGSAQSPDEEPVVITGYTPGEEVVIEVEDPAAGAGQGAGLQVALRDTDAGAVASVSGTDVVVFPDALARDLEGHVRVLDATAA